VFGARRRFLSIAADAGDSDAGSMGLGIDMIAGTLVVKREYHPD
jgi:hypothetical protein